MKNFQQNLLVVLALLLCGLCAFQWRLQSLQRERIETFGRKIYERDVAIQEYTNRIQNLDRQAAQWDSGVTELRAQVITNEQNNLAQRREINRLRLANESLTNQVAQYTNLVATMEAKLGEAYDGVKKQNAAIKELVAQRDDLAQKLNESVKDRNEIVAKYNDLVDRVKKLQASPGK
jgi:chromosome segregation ATPase